MHVVCPHCHNPIEVVRIVPREEIACPSCGSSFHLEMGSTTSGGSIAGRKLGKFELIDTVGQGGFGTVYKARDPELDRVVAVKVPRAGNVAGPQELDRFLREARSAAQLRHPSIVSVHEVGQADGLPYIVSDFVQGVTLADLLSARRPSFREAAELIAVVADALQYAHEHRVIHRDVKPSNIMIGEDGRPFVMDFGLAKREAGEITMTVEGQVLGTPAYMAPEQARGEGHEVDGRADVYSLGVVLYQLLTGELPFRGTQRMLLLQVLQDEPRPPRRLNDRIPRDLETICLKAMAKEPGRRYPTARELADELRRWLKGEAIRARPEGRWERAVRWVRRRPAVAALLALFVVTLLSGTAVSTYFALDARRREQDTKDALGKVTEREKQVREANTQLNDKTTELEETLADNLLRAVGHDADKNTMVTDPEIEALWELARSNNERVRQLFIERGLQRAMTTRQLRNRADMAVHAAVGLDPARRRHLEEALLTRLRDRNGDFPSRTDCVLIGHALCNWSPEFASAAARQAVQALGGEQTTDYFAKSDLVDELAALAPRLEAGEASAAARQILENMRKTDNINAMSFLAQALAALAPRLEPEEASADARQAARLVLEAMGNMNNRCNLAYPAQALAALAPRLEPEEASAYARQALVPVLEDMRDTIGQGNTNGRCLAVLARALAALAPRLDPEEASVAAQQALMEMGKTPDSDFGTDRGAVRVVLAEALAALAPRLEPAEASNAARQILEAMGKTTDPVFANALTKALAALAPRLTSVEASAAVGQALEAMGKTTDGYVRLALARVLKASLAPRLKSGEASAAARHVLEAMRKTKEPYFDLPAQATVVTALAPWLDRGEALAAARQILEAMEKSGNPYVTSVLAKTVASLAPRLDPGEASAVARQALETTGKAKGLSVEVLAALAPWLDPTEASAAARQAARPILEAMSNSTPYTTRPEILAKEVAVLAPWLKSGEASAAARHVLEAMGTEAYPGNLIAPAEALAALAPWLDPGEVSAAARGTVEAMGRTNNPFVLDPLAETTAALLIEPEPGGIPRRISSVAAGVGICGAPPVLLAGLTPLADAARPLPGRLTEQQLVDLLKMPTCTKPARQVIVRQLGWQCGQTFANEWEFVDWAREHRPDLDLTSPPVRPANP